jgi:hypothetical protein
MKGIQSTYYDEYMEKILGGKETLDAAREQLGETVFERVLREEEPFEALVDELVPSAMAAGLRRSARNQGIKGITWEIALSKIGAMERQDPDFAHAMRGLVAQDLQQMVAFQLAGQQTYRFAIALTDRLLRTNIDVPAKLFKLPHKCFQTVHQSRESIDVFCNAFNVLRPRLSLPEGSAYGGSVSTVASIVEEGSSGGRELVVNYKLALPPGGKTTSRTLSMTLPIASEGDDRLPDIISSKTMKVPDEYRAPDTSDMELFDERVSALLRLATNSTLYLISANADIGDEQSPYDDLKRKSVAAGLPAKQRKRAAHDLLTTAKTKFRDVGKHFEAVKFGSDGAASSDSSGSSRTLTKRFVVSGHWKVQRFGPKNADSKVIFIEPYSKGPEAAEIISGNYYVPDKKRKIIGDDNFDKDSFNGKGKPL